MPVYADKKAGINTSCEYRVYPFLYSSSSGACALEVYGLMSPNRDEMTFRLFSKSISNNPINRDLLIDLSSQYYYLNNYEKSIDVIKSLVVCNKLL